MDFDNVFLGLQELSPRAAERFATQPAQWLSWLESGGHAATESALEDLEPRRVLMRRCFLNPLTFGRYRTDFLRAGFTVLDCPR